MEYFAALFHHTDNPELKYLLVFTLWNILCMVKKAAKYSMFSYMQKIIESSNAQNGI